MRYLGHYDADGNFFFRSKHLRPYRLPLIFLKEKFKHLSFSTVCGVYDPDLGWSSRPPCASEDGLYQFNADGIRTISPDFQISKTAPKGVLRIALFGDSFTRKTP